MSTAVVKAGQSLGRSPRERYLMGRAAAVLAFPYMETLMVAMGYAVDDKAVLPDGTPTMMVTEKAQIMLHPEFLAVITNHGGISALGWTIAHESFHVLMNHPARSRKLLEREGPKFDVQLCGIAQDLAINPSLLHAGARMKPNVMKIAPPTGPMAPILPAHFGLQDGLTFEAYYSLLKKVKQQQPQLFQPPPQGGEGEEGDEEGDGQGGSPGDGPGKKNPKPSGNPGQGCKPKDSQTELSEGAKELSKKGSGGWSEARTERMIQNATEKARQAESQNPGSVAGGLLLELEESVKPPKVHWSEVLRPIVCHALEHRPGADTAVWISPSRKQAGVGNGIGSPRMPGLVENLPRVGVIQDTSGSMGGTLEACTTEVVGLAQAVGGEIEICYCDTVVTDGGKVSTYAQIAGQMKGGGGTDMNAALDLMQKKNVDIVICITDGYIGDPGKDRGYPLVWLITPDGGEHDIAKSLTEGWATMIKMEPEDLPSRS